MAGKRVTDAQLLAATWRQQLRKTARGVIIRYSGGGIALRSTNSHELVQSMYFGEGQALAISLSPGHLRKRLVALIDDGRLRWVFSGISFMHDREEGRQALLMARQWWNDRGIPDNEQRDAGVRIQTVASPANFSDLAVELEQGLLSQFGGTV